MTGEGLKCVFGTEKVGFLNFSVRRGKGNYSYRLRIK